MQDNARIIHLIRHGETNWNRERRAQGQQESVLTELGQQQALELGRKLAQLPVDEIYTSTSQRAVQTTELAFGTRTLPTFGCDDLKEIHMGPWEGRLYSEIEQDDPEQFHHFWHKPDRFSLAGAETFAAVQSRAWRRVQDILLQSSARNLLIVSHGVVIKTILSMIESRPLSQLWAPPKMHNCSHSSITIHADGSQRITLYSDLPYPNGEYLK